METRSHTWGVRNNHCSVLTCWRCRQTGGGSPFDGGVIRWSQTSWPWQIMSQRSKVNIKLALITFFFPKSPPYRKQWTRQTTFFFTGCLSITAVYHGKRMHEYIVWICRWYQWYPKGNETKSFATQGMSANTLITPPTHFIVKPKHYRMF